MSRHGLLELEAVLAIAARKSFRAAAPELGLSTTALSNLIGKVERQLGVRLFNRTTRSVSLTDAGLTFVSQVTPALRAIQDAMETARSSRTRRPAHCASMPSPPAPARFWRRSCWPSCGATRRFMSILSRRAASSISWPKGSIWGSGLPIWCPVT